MELALFVLVWGYYLLGNAVGCLFVGRDKAVVDALGIFVVILRIVGIIISIALGEIVSMAVIIVGFGGSVVAFISLLIGSSGLCWKDYFIVVNYLDSNYYFKLNYFTVSTFYN